MKKLLLAVVLAMLLCLVAMPVMAEETVPVKPFEFKFSGGTDVMYLLKQHKFVAGVGVDIARIYDLVNIRGQYVSDFKGESKDLIGGGVGLDVVKVVEKLGGEWMLRNITASVGISCLVDLRTKPELEPALYATIIKLF